MGIQINGQTDRISAVDGSFSIQDLAEVNVTGVATASNFKSGTSNVHSTGYECTNINATGIVTAASANFTGNVSVGGTLTYQDVTNIDSVGVITARAGVKVPDSQKIFLGTGDDLQIYHDGNNSFIKDAGTGRITISTNQLQLTNAADSEVMIKATQDSSVEFYYDSVKKFETHADGLHIGDGGNLDMPHDSSKIVMGASDDLQIYHDGNNSFIKDAGTGRLSIVTSELQVTNAADSEVMIKATQDGAVELYHDNSKKLHTYSGGVSVFGNFNLEDSDRIRLGNSSDLQIYHDGSNSYITDSGTGRLLINASGFRVNNADNTENMIHAEADGAVELFHNGSLRFQTNATATTMRGGGAHRCEGTFRPWANNTYDLGTSGDRWRNIYTNDLNLSNEGSANDVDGTWGNYTIQEGENDLFLINRRNGKKYKFNLTEVN